MFQMRVSRGSETPVNIVVVHAQAEYTPIPGSGSESSGRLRCFHSMYFRMEGTQASRESEYIDDEKEMFWWFLDSKSPKESCVWVFGWDLARHLTLLGFWKHLEQKSFTVEPRYSGKVGPDGKQKTTWAGKMVLEERPFFIVCRSKSITYKFVDIGNYWGHGLSGLAKDHKIPWIPQPDEFDSADAWRAANANRVEIVATAVQSLIAQWKSEDCGTFQMTGAMMAMSTFRKKCDVINPKTGRLDIVFAPGHKSHELEREAYFGGRTQCFFVGEKHERVYHVDCNSLFPYVMHRDNYPRRFVRCSQGESIATIRSALQAYGMVARVRIRSSDADFPVRIDGLQYHVNGTYWTTLCGRELARAITSGKAEQISTAQYYSIAPLFRSWVNYWYDRKTGTEADGNSNAGSKEFAKMILNSLYGKFAQRSRQWKDAPGIVPMRSWGGWPQFDERTGRLDKWRGVGGHAQILVEGKEPRHSFPAISAFITANAREYMRSVFEIAGYENLLYSATDSLIITQAGFERMEAAQLIHPTELGKFKIKGCYDYARIAGSNYYQLDKNIVCSGYIGASLQQGGDGAKAQIREGIASTISGQPDGSIKNREIVVPTFNPDYRGKVDKMGRWHPYNVTDPEIMSGQSAASLYRRAYSLGMAAGHIALICDV